MNNNYQISRIDLQYKNKLLGIYEEFQNDITICMSEVLLQKRLLLLSVLNIPHSYTDNNKIERIYMDFVQDFVAINYNGDIQEYSSPNLLSHLPQIIELLDLDIAPVDKRQEEFQKVILRKMLETNQEKSEVIFDKVDEILYFIQDLDNKNMKYVQSLQSIEDNECQKIVKHFISIHQNMKKTLSYIRLGLQMALQNKKFDKAVQIIETSQNLHEIMLNLNFILEINYQLHIKSKKA